MNRKELKEIKEILEEIKVLIGEIRTNTIKEKKEGRPVLHLNLQKEDKLEKSKLTMSEVAYVLETKYGKTLSRTEIFRILREKNYVYLHGKKAKNSLTIKGQRSGIFEQEHRQGKYRIIYVKANKIDSLVKIILGE